jgi:hypothetical protein
MAGIEAFLDMVIQDRDDGEGEQAVIHAVAEKTTDIWDMYEDEDQEAAKDEIKDFLLRCRVRGLLTPYVLTKLVTTFEEDNDRDVAFLGVYLRSL